MLTHTFVHANGIGYRTEMRLWNQGVLTWEDYLHHEAHLALSATQQASLGHTVRASQRALREGDTGYFSRALPAADTWRVYSQLAHTVAYLDIETTGTYATDEVTVIGLYDGEQVHTFVRGRNLDQFPEAMRHYGLLVTFFGRSFDVPVLRRAFPQVDFERCVHVDLCFVLRRLGIRGGLKQIERQFGIQRSAETDGLDGYDAVRLWQAYRGGSAEALDLLIRYNSEDIVNLQPLMRYAYDTLLKQTLPSS